MYAEIDVHCSENRRKKKGITLLLWENDDVSKAVIDEIEITDELLVAISESFKPNSNPP